MRSLIWGLLFSLVATIAHADAEADCSDAFSPNSVSGCTLWIQQNPKNPEAYYSRGIVYALHGNDDAAIADYSETINLDPKYRNAYSARAHLYKSKGQFDRALSDYTKAIELTPAPMTAIPYGARADFFFEQAQFDKAIADYTKAIGSGNNGWGPWLKGRGLAYEKVGEKTKAIADLRASLAEMTDDPAVIAALKRLDASP